MKRVLVGCDPEFVIRTREGKFVLAENFINTVYDNHDVWNGKKSNQFGEDGDIFELRPPPSDNIFNILANIRTLLKKGIASSNLFKQCDFIAGHVVIDPNGYKNPLGGHIHISCMGTDNKRSPLLSPQFKSFINMILHSGLEHTINDKNSRRERMMSGYGRPSSFRQEDNIIEYRTPPSWLVSPTLAFLYLTLAKICGLLFLNKGEFHISEKIDDITKYKSIRGINIIKHIIKIVESEEQLMNENDIARCIELLKKLPTKFIACNWKDKNFRKYWDI